MEKVEEVRIDGDGDVVVADADGRPVEEKDKMEVTGDLGGADAVDTTVAIELLMMSSDSCVSVARSTTAAVDSSSLSCLSVSDSSLCPVASVLWTMAAVTDCPDERTVSESCFSSLLNLASSMLMPCLTVC